MKPSASRSPTSRRRCSRPRRKKRPGEQQARQDQEEGEVREVLAEVGRAAGGLERVASDRHDGRCGPRRARARLALAQVREQALRESPAGVLEGRARRGREPEGGRPPLAVAPEPLAHGQRHEGLRRRAVAVPVGLVLGADPVEVDREGGIPVGEVERLRDAGVVGHEVPVGGQAGHLRDRDDLELGPRGLEAAFLAPEEVVERDPRARGRSEARGGPVVEDDRGDRVAFGGDVAARHGRERFRVERGDERVRHLASPGGHRVREVHEELVHPRGPGAGRRPPRAGPGRRPRARSPSRAGGRPPRGEPAGAGPGRRGRGPRRARSRAPSPARRGTTPTPG